MAKKTHSAEMQALLSKKDSLIAIRSNASGVDRQRIDAEIKEVKKAIELEKKKPNPLGKVVNMGASEMQNRQRFSNAF